SRHRRAILDISHRQNPSHRNLGTLYAFRPAAPRPCGLWIKVEIVTDVIRPLHNPVIERAREGVAFMRVPIDASPALLPAKHYEPFDQRPAHPFASGLGRDKDVLKVANH